MKFMISVLISFSALGAYASENKSVDVKLPIPALQQIESILKIQHTGGDSRHCKPAGAQCSMPSECCSNFCGHGQC